MDFRRTKLLLALGIMTMGMAIALVWHGWQGWVLHRGYPYNTFLYVPIYRFSDLTQIVSDAHLPSPYQSIWSGYLPASYSFIGYLAWLSPSMGTWLYLSIGSLGLWAASIVALHPMIFNPNRFLLSELSTIAVATGLTWLSYPLLIALDRANLELFMVLLVALALICFQRRWYDLGLICLFPAICFKLYPCLLLPLFLRHGYLHKIFFIGIMTVIVNLASLASYAGTLKENWHLWQKNLHFMNDFYLIQSGQLNGGASLWNTGKAVIETLCYTIAGMPPGVTIVLSRELVERFYTVYGFLSLAALLVLVAYNVLIETEFFRSAILLLILMTLSVPSGGDYRLLYANTALIIIILLSSRRRHDLMVVGLLAFAIIPKREVTFPFLGVCASGFPDTSLSTFLNAPSLLVSVILLIKDGCNNDSHRFWRQRLFRIVNPSWNFIFKTTRA